MYKNAVDRVLQGLKASADGDLTWLLGDEVPNPYSTERNNNNNSGDDHQQEAADPLKESSLAEYYLHRDKAVAFLYEAYEELEKCRILLRWSYPFALFRFEPAFKQQQNGTQQRGAGEGGGGSRFSQRGMQRASVSSDECDDDKKEMNEVFRAAQFASAQCSLERHAEGLSDLLGHKRLRGDKDEIIAATLGAQGQRCVLERCIVQFSPLLGGASADAADSSVSSSLDISNSISMSISMSMDASNNVNNANVNNSNRKSTGNKGAMVSVDGPTVSASIPSNPLQNAAAPQALQQQGMSSTLAVKGSYTQAMEAEALEMAQKQSSKANKQKQQQRYMRPDEEDDDDDYGFSSGDEEGLQVCNDVSVRNCLSHDVTVYRH